MVSIYGYLEAQFVIIKYLTKLYIYKTENLQIMPNILCPNLLKEPLPLYRD